jgi:hypothetical protein
MVLLPISGRELALRELSGTDDLLLLTRTSSDSELVRDILAGASGAPAEAIETLPAGDAETLLMLLRRALLGEMIVADVRCPSEGCGARIDVSFAVGDYLRNYTPRAAGEPPDEEGWFTSGRAAFRLPTLRDQIETSRRPAADRALLRRCVRNAEGSALRKIVSLMEKIAPTVSGYVGGTCPECGACVEVYFDVARFVLQELRGLAVEVYDHVHLLASQYGWSEAEILALPRSRRAAYVARVRREMPS